MAAELLGEVIPTREQALNFLKGLPRWAKSLTVDLVDVRVLGNSLIEAVRSMNFLALENMNDNAALELSLMFTSYMIIESLLLYFRRSLLQFPDLQSPNSGKSLDDAVGYAKMALCVVVATNFIDPDCYNFVTEDMVSAINNELSGLTALFRQDFAGYLALLR